MGSGLTLELVIPSLYVAVVCLWIATRRLPWSIALPVVIVRVGLVVAYFALSGRWRLHDDIVYMQHGLHLLDLGMTPWDLFLTPGTVDYLQGLVGGRHFLYDWWNLAALQLFGTTYHAPVLLNLVVSFATAHVLAGMLETVGFGQVYRRWIQVFVLLHWDMMTWATMFNLKDCLVQFLTVLSLASMVRFHRTRSLTALLMFMACTATFYTVRFYIPLLLLGAISLWMLSFWKHPVKFLLLPLMVLGGVYYAVNNSGNVSHLIAIDSMFQGALNFSLQPRPWNLEESYDFLLFPSIMHWIIFLPMLLGACILWRDSKTARLFLIYLVVLSLFYGAVGELQGPRHRLQASFILAWAQAHFLWRCGFRGLSRSSATASPASAQAPRPVNSLGVLASPRTATTQTTG